MEGHAELHAGCANVSQAGSAGALLGHDEADVLEGMNGVEILNLPEEEVLRHEHVKVVLARILLVRNDARIDGIGRAERHDRNVLHSLGNVERGLGAEHENEVDILALSDSADHRPENLRALFGREVVTVVGVGQESKIASPCILREGLPDIRRILSLGREPCGRGFDHFKSSEALRKGKKDLAVSVVVAAREHRHVEGLGKPDHIVALGRGERRLGQQNAKRHEIHESAPLHQ